MKNHSMRNVVILVSEVLWAAWPERAAHTGRAGGREESTQGAKLIHGQKALGQCSVPGSWAGLETGSVVKPGAFGRVTGL